MEIKTFTRMIDGTAENWKYILDLTEKNKEVELVRNVLGLLHATEGPKLGYPIDRFQHSLQSATRAVRDNADTETVVCALLHDIGDTISPDNHSQVAAAILRPYVSEKNYWVVQHHGLFQGYYYYDKIGKDPNVRDRFLGHPNFEACERFCRDWDQCSFDPNYDTLSLEYFEPMVRQVFGGGAFYFD